jgi:hypothetical protein
VKAQRDKKNQSASFCQRRGESQAKKASAPTKKLKSRQPPAFLLLWPGRRTISDACHDPRVT